MQIHEVAFSPDGKNLLVVAGTTQAKLYTREGEDGYVAGMHRSRNVFSNAHVFVSVAFNKGDPYLRDMRHTKSV
jgi:hypothetical protein